MEALHANFKSSTDVLASLRHASSVACGYLFAVAMTTYLQALLSSSAGVEKKREDQGGEQRSTELIRDRIYFCFFFLKAGQEDEKGINAIKSISLTILNLEMVIR